MFKKLFGKKSDKSVDKSNDDFIVKSPIKGKILSLEEVPDETFAGKMLGEGIAIEPTEGRVCSPVDGEVIQLFLPSKHAVCIKSNNGIEVLIHIGIDTVNMNGDGFEALVNTGDVVVKGQELIRFDIDKVKANAKTSITPVVITNSFEFGKINVLGKGNVEIGIDLLDVDRMTQ